MKILLFILINFTLVLNSQEIERFYSYPNFEIDSTENEKSIFVNFNFEYDDEFNILSTNIIDFYTDTDLAKFPDFEIIEQTDLKLGIPKDIELSLVSIARTNGESDNNKTAYGYRLISRQNRLRNVGKTLLVIDETIFEFLKDVIEEYLEVLRLSGIRCDFRLAPRSESFNAKKVMETKDIIDKYYENNNDLENVFLFGRIAVPMSGRYTPDGHVDESFGAWPTDLYYAILNGQWKDEESDTTNPTAFPDHKNIVGDGKFDNGYLPKAVSFNIGRIDMYNLPFYNESEVVLLKRYLEKDIAFRKGKIRPTNNAIMDNGFENVYRERFATEAMINFGAMFGEDNYESKRSREIMDKDDYLFFWGAAPGATNNIFDVVYADEVAERGFNSVFNTVFGSRAVEWNSENNIMRAITASEPMTLTCRWGVRPYFYNFFMGAGYTIGFCHSYSIKSVLSSNGSISMKNTVHQNLLGDPTLKMYYPDMPKNFEVEYNEESMKYEFTWGVTENAFAYNIYFREEKNGNYILLNEAWIKEDSYQIELAENDNLEFIIKAIEKVENNQGYYFEESIGAKEDKFNSVENEFDVIIYPNPSSDRIYSNYRIDRYSLVDLLGKVVKAGLNKNEIDISGIQNGSYFLYYEIGNQLKSQKIIIYR